MTSGFPYPSGHAAPIRPSEVSGKKGKVIPDAVFEAFNELIVKHYCKGVAAFGQQELMQTLAGKGIASREAFANHWLDVEDVYQAAGWKVKYEKPDYNEPGDRIFTFKKRR